MMTAALAFVIGMGAQAQDVVTVQDANNMTAKELERAAKLQKERDKATKAFEKARAAQEKAQKKFDSVSKSYEKAKKELEKAQDKFKDAEKELNKLNDTPLVK